MNVTKTLRRRRAIFAVFIVALLCRGQWTGEQNLHAMAVPVDKIVSLLIDIDHHKQLDHFFAHDHASDENISDMTHALLHVLSVMDSHMPVNFSGLLRHSFQSLPAIFVVASPLESQASPLFRPPRFA